jgi:hypothetical protein
MHVQIDLLEHGTRRWHDLAAHELWLVAVSTKHRNLPRRMDAPPAFAILSAEDVGV